MPESQKYSHPARLALIVVLVILWHLLILGRLGQLQIFKHEEYLQQALQQQKERRAIMAPRGIIYDRHMDELASSVTVSTVVAEPWKIENIPATVRRLAAILGLDPKELGERMNDPDRQTFMVVKRRIDPQTEKAIEALRTEGVYLEDESMRVYPNRELACHTLGFVNMNGDGVYGLEAMYDKSLKGKEGEQSFDVDARRRSFHGRIERAPVQGQSLVLSLDKSIQYSAERELAAAVDKYKARAGEAIVMEADTGRILALAGMPGFNCNTFYKYDDKFWRNRAVSNIFEPGSTFKVVVATAALEAGLIRPHELIDCQMGSIVINGHVFHDHKPFGLLSFDDILVYSSNVGAAKLGLRLGEQHLYEALRNLGFGSKTRIDLPDEAVGLVRDWHDWSGLSIGAISFGQEVGVTSLQILTAINAIANGGYRVRPSVVDRLIDEKGDLVYQRTTEKTRIMRPETAATVRDAFEGVVLRGTGKSAALEGYRAAGKTGTAQKIVDGHYSATRYVSSFIGFAPMPHPRVTILVQIDEPHGAIYGGTVSAPVFQKIAQEVLLQLRVPPDSSLPLLKFTPAAADAGAKDFLPNATELPPLIAKSGSRPGEESQDTISVQVDADTVEIPDFRGMAMRTVLGHCLALKIRLQAEGSGIAVFQQPPPGTRIPAGETCLVTFSPRGTAVLSKVPGAARFAEKTPAFNAP